VPLITTTVQVLNDQKKIVHHKKSVASKYGTQEPLKPSDGQEKLTPELLEMSGVNLAFSKKGLEKVGWIGEYLTHTLMEPGVSLTFASYSLTDGTCGS
jgi:hypothetical protein